jgi:hypothetical protein
VVIRLHARIGLGYVTASDDVAPHAPERHMRAAEVELQVVIWAVIVRHAPDRAEVCVRVVRSCHGGFIGHDVSSVLFQSGHGHHVQNTPSA